MRWQMADVMTDVMEVVSEVVASVLAVAMADVIALVADIKEVVMVYRVGKKKCVNFQQ